MKKISSVSPSVLRIGIALVFIWFGVNQITDTNAWIGYIPDWVMSISGMSAATVVLCNAIFEIVFGSALLFGFCTRIVAFVLMLHMIDITYAVGFDAIGVRDFGLSIATIAIWLQGADHFSLDSFVQGSESNSNTPIPNFPAQDVFTR